jgi:hypothetical protein
MAFHFALSASLNFDGSQTAETLNFATDLASMACASKTWGKLTRKIGVTSFLTIVGILSCLLELTLCPGQPRA